MKPNDRTLAFAISGVAALSLGIFFLVRHSPLSPKEHPDAPTDSADAPLHGADWNGALPIASASPEATALPTLPTASAAPFDSAHPPPLSAIPAPIVPLPMDDSVSEKQRARDLEMLNDQVHVLERQADLADAEDQPTQAAALRVRAARTRARIASLRDASAP